MPMIRERKMTKVFNTPCNSPIVTMSPLATWATSWPSTASASSGVILRSKPLLTATRALLRFIPVAKALTTSEGKIPTSGVPMPARCAWRSTVCSSQRSCCVAGVVMTCTRIERFAIHFDRASEMNAPPKPNSAEMMSRVFISRPRPPLKASSRPNTRKVMLMSSNTEKFTSRNNKMRMIFSCLRKAETQNPNTW